jgi:hypothetical protein
VFGQKYALNQKRNREKMENDLGGYPYGVRPWKREAGCEDFMRRQHPVWH